MAFVLIDPQLSESFSRGLMRLLRPEHLRDEDYGTDFYCRVVTHPSPDGTFATWDLLEIPSDDSVAVHDESDGSEIRALIDMFVQAEAMTEGEADAIKSGVQAAAGETVSVSSFIPVSWSPYVLTFEQASAAGYFVYSHAP